MRKKGRASSNQFFLNCSGPMITSFSSMIMASSKSYGIFYFQESIKTRLDEAGTKEKRVVQ